MRPLFCLTECPGGEAAQVPTSRLIWPTSHQNSKSSPGFLSEGGGGEGVEGEGGREDGEGLAETVAFNQVAAVKHNTIGELAWRRTTNGRLSCGWIGALIRLSHKKPQGTFQPKPEPSWCVTEEAGPLQYSVGLQQTAVFQFRNERSHCAGTESVRHCSAHQPVPRAQCIPIGCVRTLPLTNTVRVAWGVQQAARY